MKKKWMALAAWAIVFFLLFAFAFPAMMGQKIDAAWIILSAVAAAVGTIVGNWLDTKLPRKTYRAYSPIRRFVQHFLAAAIVGAAAVVIAQPWEPPPDGWPWWRTAVFAGFCFFGMWGASVLCDWAHRKAQEKKERQPENDSNG